MDYTKLEGFLNHIYETSTIFDKDSTPVENNQYPLLKDYAQAAIGKFWEVDNELTENKVLCTTELQVGNLKKHYYDKLHFAFDNFCGLFGYYRTEYGQKISPTFAKHGYNGNPWYREENFMSDEEFDILKMEFESVNNVITYMNLSLPVPVAQTNVEPNPENTANHFCQSMPLNKAREHFKVFTEKNSKNKKPFLTVEQFNSFIDRAFNGKIDVPKQKFNQIPKGEKLLIQAVFYEFYNTYCFEYFNTMQCQEKFIKLLTDNFDGWDYKNVKENFNPKAKKRL